MPSLQVTVALASIFSLSILWPSKSAAVKASSLFRTQSSPSIVDERPEKLYGNFRDLDLLDLLDPVGVAFQHIWKVLGTVFDQGCNHGCIYVRCVRAYVTQQQSAEAPIDVCLEAYDA